MLCGRYTVGLRAERAALLLSRFDLVLLDEPTNDLDLAGLDRLEAFVHGQRGGVVLVSHDREFLARCVNRIVELDLAQNAVSVHDGGLRLASRSAGGLVVPSASRCAQSVS